MNNVNHLSQANWRREPPAKSVAIETLRSESGLNLPEEYLQFLSFSNGGEGELGVEPGWFQLWPAEKVLEHNKGYEVSKWVPGFFGFGSSSGGELLAFNIRSSQSWKIYMIPFISMEEKEALLVAEDFKAFVQVIGHVCPD